MKIEKVNENQIRCTLTREDLADRQLKLSELAYGTEKAKMLFRDMMQQAAYECGFEAEDIPLMIEAIPLSADTIILIITKVEYPEELDTRFSQFAPGDPDDDVKDEFTGEEGDKVFEAAGADDILDLVRRLQAQSKGTETSERTDDFIPVEKDTRKDKQESEEPLVVDITKLFVFDELDEVNRLARVLKGFYNGCNVLYKNKLNRKYYLIISKSQHTPEEFNKVCNILAEYAHQEKYSSAIRAYFEEHYELILKEDALQILSKI
ncbi:adaptor protein MecA [Petralouisia muris]|jgi:adapter protein MecA 1/2|uniref:Adaptor protein MecA n=1 Tax=Petralouisia muris TaxID=3032872 RepID=A0AC61RUN5_9FIRM|nr:adaptor protein MecA [Petralouisia muris]TGY95591.1 adaptor protein MecA [Petralouisia muris]